LARFEVSPAIIDWITKRREHGNRILVVGTRDDMRDLADHLSRSYPGAGRLIGYVSETAAEAQDRTAQPPLLGAVSALQAILEQHQVDEMFVNLARQDWHTIKEVLESADASRVLVRIALPHFGALQERVPILPEVHEDYVYLHVSTFTNVERTLKRFLDVVIGLGCMIFLTPFCLIIAALIKLDSPGPVFFRQKRVGQGQCLFDVFKFRTMKENSEVQHKEAVRHLVEKDEAYFREVTGKRSFYKITNEEAVTRMGRWLRRSSLDELPQLINVLRGEMSLVGPRPLPSYEVELLKPWQHLRHQVRPGMTGFWQVFGRSVVSHEDMILMDTYYVINWSLAMDFRILLRTMLVILVGRGAV
jgi:exopolysaccharide biosynthesis polyprenyl glycosylphosphotransferase